MKRRILLGTILVTIALGAGACSRSEEKAFGGAVKEEASEGTLPEENLGEAAGGVGKEENQAAAGNALPEEPQRAPEGDALPEDAPSPEESAGKEFVGIKAHVKEIHGSQLLISSDSDGYPGVFAVDGAEEMAEFDQLQGGTFIYILMQDMGEKDGQGIAKYRAEQILPLSGDEELGQEDILLTEVPTFRLWDVLSSKNDFTELRSGNYSWNVEEGGEGAGVIACGAAPLEQAGMEFTVRLKLPEYRGMDSVPYLFSTKAAPDILTVRRWDASDIGNAAGEEERVTKFYYQSPLLELEAGKVYEFSAEWQEKNVDKNKFYGNASYVLVTE